LHEGDEIIVRVLKNGAPYTDFSLNAVAAGEVKGETRNTDSIGRVTFGSTKQINEERRELGKRFHHTHARSETETVRRMTPADGCEVS
jgi:hypothetical protein